jgi:hypothetical protein
MFAAAIAPHDSFDEQRVREAVRLLGNNPDDDLACAYCGERAETWDHIFATVKDSRFSGHGHRLGNLLPCCKLCNSRKGNKPWQQHLASLPLSESERLRRAVLIERYIGVYGRIDSDVAQTIDQKRLEAIRSQILSLMAEGDEIAHRIRSSLEDC